MQQMKCLLLDLFKPNYFFTQAHFFKNDYDVKSVLSRVFLRTRPRLLRLSDRLLTDT